MRRKKSSSKVQKESTSFGDSLRERISLRSKSEQDIGEVWAEQKRQRREALLLDRELKNTKKQAKELKKKLKQHHTAREWGLSKRRSLEGKKLSSYIIKISSSFKRIRISKKSLSILGVVLIILVIAVRSSDSKSDISTLGVTTSSSQLNPVTEENRISRDDVLFEVMTPNGINESDLKTVSRKSPAGDIIFSYQETKEDSVIEVTEQQLPENFIGNEEAELQKAATELQATSVIQINDVKIYHGVSEKAGVQSLITIKNDVLILIQSSKKQSDEFWTGYYLSLQ